MRRIYEAHTIDNETGAVLKSHTIYSKKIEYYYSQLNDKFAEEVINLTGLELKMIILLIITANSVTNELSGNKSDRLRILKSLNIKSKTYYNIRYLLRRKGMIIEYNDLIIVNPEYFWRGTVKDREVLLEEIRNERLNEVA